MNDTEMRARRAVRAELLERGLPASHVDEVVDIGFHAANCAVDTLRETIFRSGDSRVQMTAVGVAISIAQSRLAAIQAEILQLAAEQGLKTHAFTVEAANG